LRAPEFWRGGPSLVASLLGPLSVFYRAGNALRRAFTRPFRAPVPVICVGGLVAGGSGKTPAAIALAEFLLREGIEPHFVSRGYQGKFSKGRVARRIDPNRHDVGEAGDEALLLVEIAPVWVCSDRREAARAAHEAGAQAIIMDDGFQDPSLVKDLSLLIVDGSYAFGNRRIIPAGPLREPIAAGLARADAVVLVGENIAGVTASIPSAIPLLRAVLSPASAAEKLAGRDVVAFAGIGRPEKFFRTLEELGCRIKFRRAFGDHHLYERREIEKLIEKAERNKALLVTTAKDMVRVPGELRGKMRSLPVRLVFRDPEQLVRLLRPLFARR
jgi:tetraacyldisaccharide 4'-kinase